MKKFFIFLCGILIMGNAVARDTLVPKLVEPSIRNAWGSKLDEWNSYLTDVWSKDAKFRFALEKQFNTRAGTYGENNEGGIVTIIATDIWENGGNFCTRQIQSAWSGNKDWIDYYDNTAYKCEKICKSGYSGANCSQQTLDCNKMGVNYLTDLNDVTDWSLRILSGKTDGNVTTSTNVFNYKNDYSTERSYAMVLGVLERRQHSVLVAPVRVLAEHREIKSAYAHGNGILLCAPGYVATDSITKDCVIAPQCGGSDKSLCPNETSDGFDATQHEWRIGSTCKYFRCQNNKGFRSKNDKTCVECDGGALAYIKDDGTCDKCAKGEIVNSDRTNCTTNNVTPYSKDQMKSNDELQCWLETDARKFLGCVKGRCSGATPCWDKTSGCKACD